MAQNCDAAPTVLRVGYYRFFFVSPDRTEPPHVGFRRENMVANYWLDPVVLERAGGFTRVELNTIANIIQEHQQQLIENWNEFFDE
jgi:hypothetical protein